MNPIILAADFPTLQEADAMVAKVRPYIGMLKVGLELFTAHGWDCVAMAKNYDLPIFLDLKLYDIPNTVKRTVGVVCNKLSKLPGEHFLSIHCLGAKNMCRSALEAARMSNVKVTGITLLTSFDWQDLREMGYRDTRIPNQTIEVARIGRECLPNKTGLNHFVCSPTQLNLMRKHFGDDVVLITPGIRAEGLETQDHKNSKPASFALKNRANWLVIGRPITQAADPEWEAKNFAELAGEYVR